MTDDELRDRLRAADPAASLPPADPERVARLLEDVMSTELTTENRETGTRDRGPLTWLVAAAAVVVIAGIGLFAFLAHDDEPAPPTAAGGQTVTEAEATGIVQKHCVMCHAARPTHQAFKGTEPPDEVGTGRFSSVSISRREFSDSDTWIGTCRSESENSLISTGFGSSS